jgi:hypothetical protein
MEDHKSYELIVNRPCDFIVKYKFLLNENGGRTTTPSQGYRSDFIYAEDKAEDGLWIIWPEFLDQNDNVIVDKNKRVDLNGKAKMWIMNEQFLDKHRTRIKIGQKGFFMEGRNKVAECEVVEIVGLKSANT